MFIAGFFIPIFPWIYTIIAVLGFGLHSKISDLKNRQSRKPFDENKYWAYVCAFALAVELATGSVVAGIIAYHLGYLS